MLGFHIDMNVGQFTQSYLEEWLKELSRLGYDTILWEVENNIQWENCPECCSPDAFSKEQFHGLLRLCADLGLESIPLFQTIGHCEYVLKHEKYKHLAEDQNRIDQYCPRNPALLDFLRNWIDEYLELFGDVRLFHLGADEAFTLGSCDACRAYAKATSLSTLYIDHINAVSRPLIERGIRPAIWADMILQYNEALQKLSRDIVVFDWMYDTRRGDGKVPVWGKGLKRAEEFDQETLQVFGEYLYPKGDEPGRAPETFYTADYLAANGFDVVTCPGSSSAWDTVFAPRTHYHMTNVHDSFAKGRSKTLVGSMLTSWTAHLFPYELQRSCIDLARRIKSGTSTGLDCFEKEFVKDRFGVENATFWRTCALLSKRVLFSSAPTLGYSKACLPVAKDYVQTKVAEARANKELVAEIENCRERRQEYESGLKLLEEFEQTVTKGREDIGHWKLAARNLIHRAKAGELLLKSALCEEVGIDLVRLAAEQAQELLSEMHQLRQQTREMYEGKLKPTRREEVLAWIYDSMDVALTAMAQQTGQDAAM